MGPTVKQARERVRLSQKQLAELLDVSQSVVSLWETGMALPPPELLGDLARALKIDTEVLAAARERTEARNASAPRSIDYILYQADEFLRAHPSVTIWVCGPDQLPVLENRATQQKWLLNLEDGVTYNLLWVLDRVESPELKAALPHFAQIADEAREKRDTQIADALAQGSEAPKSWGKIRFHAVSADEEPDTATIATYDGFCNALRNEDPEIVGLLELLPYVSTKEVNGEEPATGQKRRKLRAAINQLLRIWHPETSIILYHPDSVKTPPIANIRLMYVSEEIHTLGGALERPMYWLSQLGAARFSHVIETIAGALEVLQPLSATSHGDDQ